MGIGPSIDPSGVGVTGLLWLFFSYGYALFYAANMIGEGSELLLLVPSMAGLVGGVVLPLLGAVPDGGKKKVLWYCLRFHSIYIDALKPAGLESGHCHLRLDLTPHLTCFQMHLLSFFFCD